MGEWIQVGLLAVIVVMLAARESAGELFVGLFVLALGTAGLVGAILGLLYLATCARELLI